MSAGRMADATRGVCLVSRTPKQRLNVETLMEDFCPIETSSKSFITGMRNISHTQLVFHP